MGHSCQVVSLLAAAKKSCFAIPLVSRIHEGVVFSNKLLEPWALMPIIFGWKICSQLKGVPAINMFTKEALNTEMQFAENLQPITDIYRLALLHRGFCKYISSAFPLLVWNSFGSWLWTIRPGICPSEQVTAIAMRNCLPEKLRTTRIHYNWNTIRNILATHVRVTTTMNTEDGQVIDVRTCTTPTEKQHLIYNKLHIKYTPLGRKYIKSSIKAQRCSAEKWRVKIATAKYYKRYDFCLSNLG